MKILKTATRVTAAAFALACAACATTPPVPDDCPPESCRPLHENEHALLQKYFGPELDYTSIRLRRTRLENPSDVIYNPSGTTKGNNIYIYANEPDRWLPDLTRHPTTTLLLVHEATHVWQDQKGTLASGNTLALQWQRSTEREKIYSYNLSRSGKLADYNIEQQAEIVGRHAAYVSLLDMSFGKNAAALDAVKRKDIRLDFCLKIRAHEAVLIPALHIRPEPHCVVN